MWWRGLCCPSSRRWTSSCAIKNGRVTSPRDALGKVLVMTFLFTSCDDVCPAQAQIIGEAARKAGKGVEVYAVSVDPVADTPVRVRSFLRRTGLGSDGFRYLLGTREQLRPVWARYGIVPIAASPAEAEAAARVGIAKLAGEQGEEEGEGRYHVHSDRKEVPAAAREVYPDTSDERYRGRPRHDLPQFEHSAYVLLIDKRGRQRVGFPFEQLDATLLRHDIRALAGRKLSATYRFSPAPRHPRRVVGSGRYPCPGARQLDARARRDVPRTPLVVGRAVAAVARQRDGPSARRGGPIKSGRGLTAASGVPTPLPPICGSGGREPRNLGAGSAGQRSGRDREDRVRSAGRGPHRLKAQQILV